MPQFKETIDFLVTVHEGEVAALNSENRQLRSELEDLKKRVEQKEPRTREVSAREDGVQGFLEPSSGLELPTPSEPLSPKAFPRAEPEEPLTPPRETSQRRRTSTSVQSMGSISHHSVASVLSYRARFGQFVLGPYFEAIICILVVCNAIVMTVELQYTGLDIGYKLNWHDIDRPVQETWPHAPTIFQVFERTFTVIFTAEVSIKIALLGFAYFRKWDSYLDITVVAVALFTWITEQTAVVNATTLRLLRLVKLARFVRIVKISKILDALQLLLQAIGASLNTLFWSLLVLMVLQCIVGMTISQILQPWFHDESIDQARRQKVYRYYGTFTYAIITMFEIHLANWSPACRVLIDEVSQWYGLVLVIYRCLAGFAVLNVINAVFIQRTMKVAQNNAEWLIAQKEREAEEYKNKLKAIFKRMDTSGDGKLSREEVDEMLLQPKTREIFACMDMNAKDLEVLFELFDDGDGLISSDEFLMGTSRLKGDAKNIDMARLLSQVARVESQLHYVKQTLSTNQGQIDTICV